jgi:NADPH:quinone reductase-like Zn-dependent oxidoreductase
VRAPNNLSLVEASTLTCAGLTSWNALYGLKPVKAGDTVLVQGTGGVSLFALQFAKAAGARVIATTSSAEKTQTLKKLGADHVINEDKKWGTTARRLTPDEAGVDIVIEVGGEDTTIQSLAAIKFEGIISVIGFLGGVQPKDSILESLNKICTIRGTYVGPRSMMEDMIAVVEANDIHPVLHHKTFTLDQTREAYDYMVSAIYRSLKLPAMMHFLSCSFL